MNILKSLFFFSGRLTRFPFFLLFMLSKVILISSLIGGEEGILNPYFSYIFWISIWLDLSLVSSRLKDIGKSRFWVIAGLLGLPLVLYCFFASSKNEIVSGSSIQEPSKTAILDQSNSLEKGFWKFIIDFSGRITQKAYLFSFLGHFVIFAVIVGLMVVFDIKSKDASLVIVVLILFQGVSLVSLTIRRAHDIGRTTRWVIFNLISVIGGIVVFIMCLVMKSDSKENEYGLPADQVEEKRSVTLESRGRFDRD